MKPVNDIRPNRCGLQLVLVAAASLLAGCAVGPDYEGPSINLPTRWHQDKKTPAPQAVVLAQWWRRLNDPTLNALIADAVQDNLDVAAAKARIREARAYHQQAIGALFPSVNGRGLATRNGRPSASATGSDPASAYNQFQAGFDASWELDLFGAQRRAVEAASYGVDAADDDLRSTLLTLIGDVASYYVEARGNQARSALARRAATSQRETAALTQRSFEAGSAAAVDVERAFAQSASTEANVPTYDAAYAQEVHRLGILLGRDPSVLTQRMARSTAIPAPRLPLPTGIPADVLVNRPDVRSAERQLAQYTARIGQAEAALYPTVSLTGSVSTTGLRIGDLGKNSSIGWSFGPTLSVPVFNRGQLSAAVTVAQAQRDRYDIAWRSAVVKALEDVENAIVSLAQDRIKIRSLAEAARRYGEAFRLSRSLYETGSTSFLDVLDAERSRYSAEDALLQSRTAIAKNYIALAKALGGGWDGTIDASRPEIIDTNAGPRFARKR
ncbi:efflux transporter outer membrane subunit [Bradyrhizobium sp. F1.13.3]|uniref:efflux transporter outer membrane subunit n=1 Tax=Bradyrhizobium sp. F1.13.3 TaxID=3156351 RepID=UPI0033998FFC